MYQHGRGVPRDYAEAAKWYPCIGVAATALVGAHSFVDFSLQIPAVTATYCLLMGAACAQSWSSRRKTETDW